jgi:hypothetical protein
MVRCFPLSSFCVRIAPVANAEASTWRKKGLARSGCWRDGLLRMMVISWFRALVQSCVQQNG